MNEKLIEKGFLRFWIIDGVETFMWKMGNLKLEYKNFGCTIFPKKEKLGDSRLDNFCRKNENFIENLDEELSLYFQTGENVIAIIVVLRSLTFHQHFIYNDKF